jgi:predicted oxidoreductase
MVEVDSLKQWMVETLTQKDINNQYIINQQELQIYQYEKMTDDLVREIKQEKNKTLFWRIATGAAIIGGGILLVK